MTALEGRLLTRTRTERRSKTINAKVVTMTPRATVVAFRAAA